ncbi:MAG: HAD-IA family hydrolase, partial [Betaproteobacteria bacterium]|nr:HAD-IA family hydrolase [Betaproteobacteria bacterium]
ALSQLTIVLDTADRARLLDSYRHLAPCADAAAALDALAPRPRWILSNGTLDMLEPLIAASALAGHLDGVLTVDAAGIYKPSPRVYRLAVDRLGLAAADIGFVSSNGWDATGAKAFGLTTFWINRNGLPVERHGPAPDYVLGSLTELAALDL